MNIDMALSMNMPCVIFSTFHRFENYYTDDMQCGDLDDQDFRTPELNDISTRVDPFNLIEFDFYHSFRAPTFGFENQMPKGKKISRQRCADILFEEMKELSATFAHGKNASIIGELIHHFHYGNGKPWKSLKLDAAFHEVVTRVQQSSILRKIEELLHDHIFKKENASIDFNFVSSFKTPLFETRLPKFIRFEDNFNGLGISVHDVYALEIELVFFKRYALSWSGLLRFKAQDHFGLGKDDITNDMYRNFRFFRIWFFLQRHGNYAFKPFLTDFSTHVHVNGGV